MKRLLKLIITLLILFTILIVIPLILLSKETTPPVEQYVTASETAFYTDLDQELSELITDSESDYVNLTIDEAFINRAIQKELSKSNPNYLDINYEDELSYKYMMMLSSKLGFKGIWVELTDDQIIVIAGIDYANSPDKAIYQTGFEVIFDIVLSEDDQYYLKLNKIEIGKLKLPLNSAFKLASFIVKQLSNKSLNELIAENLTFGAFDSEEFSFTVGESELTDYLYEIDPTFAALLKVIYQENLLILDLSDEGFDVSLNIGVFRRLLTDLDEPAFTSWENDVDKAAFMASLAAQALLNITINPLDPRIDLDEADLNAILDYTLGEKVQFEFPIEFTLLGEEIEYSFNSTNLFIRMNDDELSIHLKMTLSKTGMPGTFDMQFNLSSNVSMNLEGDMVLTIINSNIGEIELNNEILTMLFSVFDDTLVVGNTIVIPKEKLNEMFEGSNIIFNDTYVINGELRMHFGLDN
ncbi:MAG: hypothetical protein CVV56_02455 [Tenericutes bacterium HGW-Tenericutes-1]|jgi:hypothetical protein|nr:MAG: hypothetical protein CVV56_02455 [Tenericutes bacterium HGW-Tenericutes-1]